MRLLMGLPDQRPCAFCLHHRGEHVTWLQVQINNMFPAWQSTSCKVGVWTLAHRHASNGSWQIEVSGARSSMDAPAFDEWQVFSATAASRQQTEEPSSSRFVQVNCMAQLPEHNSNMHMRMSTQKSSGCMCWAQLAAAATAGATAAHPQVVPA